MHESRKVNLKVNFKGEEILLGSSNWGNAGGAEIIFADGLELLGNEIDRKDSKGNAVYLKMLGFVEVEYQDFRMLVLAHNEDGECEIYYIDSVYFSSDREQNRRLIIKEENIQRDRVFSPITEEVLKAEGINDSDDTACMRYFFKKCME